VGKGTITGGGADGLYTATLVLSRQRITDTINKLTADITAIDNLLTAADTEVTAAENDVAAQRAQIALLETDPVANRSALDTARKDLEKKLVTLFTKQKKRALISLKKKALQKRIDYLNSSMPADSSVSAWCCDLTTNLSGDVGTIEVPGERVGVNIQPGYFGNAPYSTARDGQLQPSVAGTPASVFFNLAMLPGWQKWMPTYRYGGIITIDYDNDTCSLNLEDAFSSAQNLPVNQGGSLSSVPIVYMD
jgi:hypothetical protein